MSDAEAPDRAAGGLWSRSRKDFRIDWFHGSGAGGQHRNKHANCCRITDLQTGIVARCADHRSQAQNRGLAFRRLAAKLTAHYAVEARGRGSSDGQVATRTYHEGRDQVKDHVTGKTYSYRLTVGRGTMGDMVTDRAMHRVGDKKC